MTEFSNNCPDRISTDSIKWNRFKPDVLPLWIADMDFRSPEAVIQALTRRVEHGVFGYPVEPAELKEVISARLLEGFAWTVKPEEIIFLPGVITGFHLACAAFAPPGSAALVQTPVYPPLLHAPETSGLERQENELVLLPDGQYEIDFDSFEESMTDKTRVFLLCNPHNPVGRVFTRKELERMAEICLRRNVVICSDEIHCDLVYHGHTHLPIASLSPETAKRTVTLMAPSKTFNIAGLKFSFAVVQDTELARQFNHARRGLVGEVNLLGMTAALAAYQEGQTWLNGLIETLESNRKFLHQFVRNELPWLKMVCPEGTYLAWLDCRGASLPQNAQEFFLEKAKVGLNDGCAFGRGGDGFVRLNFGCSRPILAEALGRMKVALDGQLG